MTEKQALILIAGAATVLALRNRGLFFGPGNNFQDDTGLPGGVVAASPPGYGTPAQVPVGGGTMAPANTMQSYPRYDGADGLVIKDDYLPVSHDGIWS